MAPLINRRDFLKLAAGFGANLSLAAGLAGCKTGGGSQGKPWFDISISEWSFHRMLFAKEMDHLDFARICKEKFGIHALEYVNQFFPDKANNRAYLDEMLKRTRDLGMKNVLIMIDDEGEIGNPNKAERQKAVQNHFKWVEAAKYLGCHAIRLNAYSSGTYDEQLERCADGLNQVVDFGAKLGMNILVENHGEISSNGKWVAALMRKVNKPNCGTLPDFGNFEKDQDRYQAVTDMMPWAKGVSAKSHDFDAAGNETSTDYRRMLRIVKAAGYRGYMELEYEGERLSEFEGVRLTKKLLEKVRAELS